MTRAEILVEVEGEIARLKEVRRLLAESARGLKKIQTATRSIVASGVKQPRSKGTARKNAGKKRLLSAAGRRRIVLGQKKRWARQRAARKNE